MAQIRPKLAPHHLLLLAIIAGGLALRVIFISHLSIWLDEAISWRFAHFSLYELWHEILDAHPPLYYSLLHLWLIFGNSEAALRSLSVLAGTVSIALTYLLARLVAGTRVGLIAAALVAASAVQIDYSREARSYALLTAAGLAASIGLLEILTASAAGLKPRLGSFAWYVIGTLLALYTHNIALLLFGLTLATGAAEALRTRSRPLAVRWLTANAVVILGWLWWLPVVIAQSAGALPEIGWLKPPDLGTALTVLGSVYGPNVYFLYALAVLLFVAVACVGLVKRPHDLCIAYIAAAAIGLPLLEIAISLIGRPVFMERTIVWLGPYFAVLIARAFLDMRGRMAAIGVAFLLVIELIGVRNFYQEEGHAPWRQTAQTMSRQLCDGDVIILEPYYVEPVFTYYFTRLPADISVFGGYIGADITVDPRKIRLPLRNIGRDEAGISSAPRIWLVTLVGGDPETIEQTKKLLLAHHVIAQKQESGLSDYLFVAPGAKTCNRGM
jgi:mannosyltransferase